jgi:hypothetical protein
LEKYHKRLPISLDGRLLLEQSLLSVYRTQWQENDSSILKQFVAALATRWMAWYGTAGLVVMLDNNEYLCFAEYPRSF